MSKEEMLIEEMTRRFMERNGELLFRSFAKTIVAVVVLVTIACSIGPWILNSNAQSFSLFIKNKCHRGLGRVPGDGTELQKVGTSQM